MTIMHISDGHILPTWYLVALLKAQFLCSISPWILATDLYLFLAQWRKLLITVNRKEVWATTLTFEHFTIIWSTKPHFHVKTQKNIGIPIYIHYFKWLIMVCYLLSIFQNKVCYMASTLVVKWRKTFYLVLHSIACLKYSTDVHF